MYFGKIYTLTEEEIENLNRFDEVIPESSIKKINGGKRILKKGGSIEQSISTKFIKPNEKEKKAINEYIDAIFTKSLKNYHKNENSANFGVGILNDKGIEIAKLKIQAIKDKKVIIGTYDKYGNNYAHITLFKNSLIHITFVIPPSKNSDAEHYKIYYKINPKKINNWNDILKILTQIFMILFEMNLINKTDNPIWTKEWKSILFSDDNLTNEINKDYIRSQLNILKGTISILKDTPEFNLS